jgi:hypothetical protein
MSEMLLENTYKWIVGVCALDSSTWLHKALE